MLTFDGKKLKRLREQKGLTQEQLGRIVGKGTNHVSNYENGHATPPSETLLSLLDFFKVTARDLSRAQAAEVGE